MQFVVCQSRQYYKSKNSSKLYKLLDNEATRNTSPVSKMTFSIIVKPHTPHCKHTTFQSHCFLHLTKKAVAFKILCEFSVMRVILTWWEKYFYLPVLCKNPPHVSLNCHYSNSFSSAVVFFLPFNFNFHMHH
jgi:hypothetical protein